MSRFQGRVCIVSGGGSGLGRATALRLAAEGGSVAVLDLALESAQRVAREVEAAGGRAHPYQVDVADPASVRAAVDAAARDLGRPQVLVSCAGTGCFANSHEMPFEDWKRIIDVNLTGTFLVAQAVLPHLLDGGGSIVTVASNAGLMGIAYSAAYCASKGGVVNLTRALSDEYVKRGVRVNCVAPGGMATPFQNAFRNMPQGADLSSLGKIRSPLGMAEPEEVAALIAFVASDEGRYMTGAIVSIDGGITT
ncbi:MAG: SDR family oxidoreductase [Deltaproteobacteria bacterium]|nr:SDR family oxidoreductase [Deltaproteobacteria bacterium]